MVLTILQVSEGRTLQDFRLERTVKAFVFALGLRMIGATMTDRNAKLQQPNGQAGVAVLGGAAPTLAAGGAR